MVWDVWETEIVETQAEFLDVLQTLEQRDRWIIQPLQMGKAVSLSCFCKDGRGWVICCNQQNIEIENRQFVLKGCLVNIPSPFWDDYQLIVSKIAAALPGLWGYIGVDIIETVHGPRILEINPRLTTSYVGIKQATGISVAEQVITMLHSDPELLPDRNQTFQVTVN